MELLVLILQEHPGEKPFGSSKLPMCQFHLISKKVLTNDFPNHEQQAEGTGHTELAPRPLLLEVAVTARTRLGMTVMVAFGSQLNGLQVQAR